jgi:phage-related minor tail protein
MPEIDTLSVSVTADTAAFKAGISDCDKLAKSFGKTMAGSLAASIVKGKSLTETFTALSAKLATMALKSALTPMMSGMFSGGGGGMFGSGGGDSGGDDGGTQMFAKGGVVSSPTYFPMSSGKGLMGEAGSEAIMPLSRTADGRLGVAGGGGSSNNITFNVQASDAASFQRSEGEINAMLAKAVGRGNRNL